MDDFADILADATAEAERAGTDSGPAIELGVAPAPIVERATPEPEPAAHPATADTTPAAEAAPVAQSADGVEPEPWYKGRIDKLTFKNRELAAAHEAAVARTAALEALLAAGGTPAPGVDSQAPTPAPTPPAPRVFTEADVAREAARIAEINTFNAKCDAIAQDGHKTFGKDFQKALDTLGTAGLLSPEDPSFLRIITDTDQPALLLTHLGKNPNEAAALMAMSPVKMGAELARLTDRLSKSSAPAPLSNAPAPIAPITSARPVDSVNLADDNTPDGEWFADFEKKFLAR